MKLQDTKFSRKVRKVIFYTTAGTILTAQMITFVGCDIYDDNTINGNEVTKQEQERRAAERRAAEKKQQENNDKKKESEGQNNNNQGNNENNTPKGTYTLKVSFNGKEGMLYTEALDKANMDALLEQYQTIEVEVVDTDDINAEDLERLFEMLFVYATNDRISVNIADISLDDLKQNTPWSYCERESNGSFC